jgi:hypothetical protein
MRRTKITLLTLLALASVTIWVALAQSPHYLKLTSSGPDSDGNIQVCFKIAGLGNTAATADVSVTADASGEYACKNRGQNCPSAANKQQVSGPVTASGTFPIRNGSVTGCLTLEAPDSTLNCPGNMTTELISVTYTNVVIHSAAGDRTVNGTFTSNNFPGCPGL